MDGVHDAEGSEKAKDSDQIWLNQWLERRDRRRTDEQTEKSPKHTVTI